MICTFKGLGGQGSMNTMSGRRVFCGEKFDSSEVDSGTLETWISRGIASVDKPEPKIRTVVDEVELPEPADQVPVSVVVEEPRKAKKGKKNG